MSDPEWTLAAGPWRCTVSPFGASLRRLWLEGPGGPRDVVWGYSGTANKKGGQGDVLMPWPGRIRDGRYAFEGGAQELPRNDKDGPNAIHGFLRSRAWTGEHDATTARFAARIGAADHPGYPFDLEVVVGYELLPTGLACAFVVRNAGATAAPFGAGFHPYLAARTGVDSTMLRVQAGTMVELQGLLPTGRVVDVPGDLDWNEPRPVGGVRLNHCFSGLARDQLGFARVDFGGTELWMGPTFTHLVLYSGDALGADARRALAVEPMTCAPDAFNHTGFGARTLQPGETFTGTWGIALTAGRT